MLAVGIRYLNGFVAASEADVLERPEWPPHPARVFMALAAVHFQTGADPSERGALLWLETLRAPEIHAPQEEARTAVTHFVPVNDEAGPAKALLQSAPLSRSRQPRTFARAWLADETVYLVWPDADATEPTLGSLATLCSKVHRIGHSSSLVQMWLPAADEIPAANWLPDDDRGTIQLRVPRAGTLEYLERRYNGQAVEAFADVQVEVKESSGSARRAARKRLREQFPDGPPARLRPALAAYQSYAAATVGSGEPAAPGTAFDPHFISLSLERDDGPYRHLDLPCVLAISQRLREALVSKSNDLSSGARSLLSGHDSDGAPLERPHIAFVPLAFVGHPHADGRLLGMGLALPAGVSRDQRREVLKAAARARRLLLGRLGAWRLAPMTAINPPWNVRAEAWTAHPGGATHWSTVTPIAFDRHPKTSDRAVHQAAVGRMIAEACARIRLPEPREVVPTPVSAHPGTPPAHAFPRLRRKDGSERRHVHAILVFDQPVQGPVLLGAGRYRGYGVCRPMGDREAAT